MKNKNTTLSLLLVLFVLFTFTGNGVARHNMTAQIKYVGNPYAEYYKNKGKPYIYAQNIWDMIEFKGKLYFGAGNSSNMGPATNAGPVPIMTYDPKTDLFATTFQTSEEQIDAFYIFDNALYVPGHDPKENWKWGNLYKTTDGQQWIKKRTIPFGIHTFCLTSFNNKLFAGLGTANGAAIAISDDLGDSWQFNRFPKGNRFYEFLNVGNRLYTVGTLFPEDFNISIFPKNKQPITQVVEYMPPDHFNTRPDLTPQTLFPDTLFENEDLKLYKIIRPQNIDQKAIYIGAYLHNDQQSIPFGLYLTESLTKKSISVKKISIPHKAIPWDTYKSRDYVYVLTNRKVDQGIETSILRSRNLDQWEELFYFNSTQIVRSFIFSQGTFYFSLGCEIENPHKWESKELQENTGDIFKIILYSI